MFTTSRTCLWCNALLNPSILMKKFKYSHPMYTDYIIMPGTKQLETLFCHCQQKNVSITWEYTVHIRCIFNAYIVKCALHEQIRGYWRSSFFSNLVISDHMHTLLVSLEILLQVSKQSLMGPKCFSYCCWPYEVWTHLIETQTEHITDPLPKT